MINYQITCNKCSLNIVKYDILEEEIRKEIEKIGDNHQNEYCDGVLSYNEIINISSSNISTTKKIKEMTEEEKYLRVVDLVKNMPIDMDKKQYAEYIHETSNLLVDMYKIKTIKATTIRLEELWTWEGYYSKKGDSTIHSIILQDSSVMNKQDYYNIIEYIKAGTRFDRNSIIPRFDCVNILNGVIDYSSGKVVFIPRDNITDFFDYNFTSIVLVTYTPDAKCPIIDKILEDVLEDPKKIDLVLEFIASIFILDTRFKKAFVWAGKPNSGKSTILNIINNIMGEDNRCSVTISQMSTLLNRFAGADMEGMYVNIVDEMPLVNIKNIEIFKNATGGSTGFRSEKKFKDGYNIKPFCKHVFAANELSLVEEEIAESFFSRIIFILFEKIFESQPEGSKENYKDMKFSEEEKSGLLNHLIPIIERLLEKGEYNYDSDPEKDWNEYVQKYSDNPLSKFILNCTMQDMQGWIRKDFIYQYYLLYCVSNEIRPLNMNRFGRSMNKIFGISEIRPSIEGKREYCWSGIRLNDNFASSYFKSKYTNIESKGEDKVFVTYICENPDCRYKHISSGNFSGIDNAIKLVKCKKCEKDTFSITSISWMGNNYTIEDFEKFRNSANKINWRQKMLEFSEFDDISKAEPIISKILDKIKDCLLKE